MSFHNTALIGASGQGGDYNLESSLRFRSSASAYLTRTPASEGNRTTWTWSGWVKRGALARSPIFTSWDIPSNSGFYFEFYSDTLYIYDYHGGFDWQLQTNAVYRDISAWYHIILSFDSTQAIASDRVKLYVNGEQVTSLGIATYPSQNFNSTINSTQYHNLFFGSNLYSDGYLAEVNFVDGQALTPSDFGETDSTTGVWKPKEYTGTYGTNGFYLPFTEKTDFKSFDLDGTGDYISAPASEYSNYINGSGDFTIEWWANYDALPSDAGWYAQDSGSAVVSPFNLFQQTNNWRLYATTANGAWNVFSNTLLATTSLTTGRWYHIACVRNGSTLTLYVDGVSQGTANIGTASLWTDTSHNLSLFNDWQSAGGGGGFNGRVSNYRLVKGTAVYTGNFTPPTTNLENISGTTILLARSTSTADLSGNITTTANGNLSLSDNNPPLSSGIGDDTSGNDNHWASNNIDLTSNATTYDIMNDVPTLTDEDTANFATLNPLDKGTGNLTVSDANLKASVQNYTVFGTMGVSSGKYYWELTMDTSVTYLTVGIGSASLSNNVYMYNQSPAVSYYAFDGTKFVNGTNTSYGATFTTGDVIGIALDADNDQVTFYKNNTSQGTITGLTSGVTWMPVISTGSTTYTESCIANFGQKPFAYTPPAGYLKLNTYNLPDSTIVDGSQYMNTVTYTGNGTSQDITVGFEPEAFWVKNRTNAYNHAWSNFVTDTYLYPNLTNVEGPNGSSINQLSDGFNLNTSSNVYNASGNSYVSWNWRGSDSSAVSNTDGSITSTVSANTDSGFSVVTYSGNGTNGATVGHGLGSAPKMVIVKQRNGSTYSWTVHHDSLTSGYVIALESQSAQFSRPTAFNSTAPDANTFTLGTDLGTNSSSGTYVAYCFAEVEGFSKIGSYTGNGSADGPFIYTGFRPAFILWKLASSTSSWAIWDGTRVTYNPINTLLFPDQSVAESSGNSAYNVDLLSNGFKWRTSNSQINGSGSTYIYMAFAENPFKNSLAR